MSDIGRWQLDRLLEALEAIAYHERVANILRVAAIDQASEQARLAAPSGYPADPSIRIRDYLTDDEWKVLGL